MEEKKDTEEVDDEALKGKQQKKLNQNKVNTKNKKNYWKLTIYN